MEEKVKTRLSMPGENFTNVPEAWINLINN